MIHHYDSSFFRKGGEEWQKVIGEHSIDLDLTQAGFLIG